MQKSELLVSEFQLALSRAVLITEQGSTGIVLQSISRLR